MYGYPNPYQFGTYTPTQPRQDMAGVGGYPQSTQTQQTVPQGQQGGFMCRPVTSRLEAEAVQVDFIGPGTLMPDLSHGAIYLKRFNPNTGASDFLEFVYQKPQEPPAPVQYATVAELNALRAEIEQLRLKGGDEA